MKKFLTDTHAILWFIAEDKRLPAKIREIFLKAEKGEVQIIIPTIVLAELLYICEKGKAPLPLIYVIERIKMSTGFKVVPFDLDVLEEMLDLPKDLEMHDRIICATAILYDAIIITKDKILTKLGKVKTIWQ